MTSQVPNFIVDVTTPVRFNLDDAGLKLMGKTKSSIMGFYNPIPEFMTEHDHPVLCIIYKKSTGNDQVLHVKYFNDSEDVFIPLD